jgi:hypothetical protein
MLPFDTHILNESYGFPVAKALDLKHLKFKGLPIKSVQERLDCKPRFSLDLESPITHSNHM